MMGRNHCIITRTAMNGSTHYGFDDNLKRTMNS